MLRRFKALWTRSIRRQMILGIAFVHAILMTIFVTDMVFRQRSFLQGQSVSTTEIMAQTLAASSTSWVLAEDVIGLEEVVLSQTDFPDLLYIMILAPDGRVLGHSNADMVGKYVIDDISAGLFSGPVEPCQVVVNEHLVDVAAPIVANGQLVGWARVAVSQQSINAGLRIITRDGIFYILLAIIVGSLFAVLMAQGITRSLHHLVKVAERQKAGDDKARSTLVRSDELGSLSDSLNSMIDAVAHERERLRVTLYSIADGVITTDTELKVIFVNKAAEKLLGVKQAAVAGNELDSILRIDYHKDQVDQEGIAAKVLSTGEAHEPTRDGLLTDDRGMSHNVAQACAPIRDSHDKVVGLVLVIRDTTNEKKLQDHMLKTRSLESVGLLAGGIAHDFNNILTAILGNVNLSQDLLGEKGEISEILHCAEKAIFRARDLTLQLLTFSKGGDPVMESHSLAVVIQDAASFALSGSNVRSEYQFSDDLNPVFVDKGQINQVIQNLIINASQAMPGGGVVRVSAENITFDNGLWPVLAAGKFVKLVISDEGVGIPNEYLKQIFDPYFSTKQKGSGLGLAVTHSIINKHDGHIEVVSQPGKGTDFTIYLPAADSLPQEAFKPELARPEGQGRILIVDDEEPVRRILNRMLTRAGYQVISAETGVEGVEAYATNGKGEAPVDLVIMDLTIPGGIGGQEAAKQILAEDPKAKIIVSSGYSNDPVMANHEQYGFKGVLGKPYTTVDLIRVVHQTLSH